jgi:hypothetical protein
MRAGAGDVPAMPPLGAHQVCGHDDFIVGYLIADDYPQLTGYLGERTHTAVLGLVGGPSTCA